jgi:hypothetical protein
MARTFLVPALSASAVGLAAAFLVGPSLVTAPRGEPIIVEDAAPVTLLPASLDGSDCDAAPTVAASDAASVDAEEYGRVVTLTLQPRGDGVHAALRELLLDAPVPGVDGTLILVLGPSGRILALLHAKDFADKAGGADASLSCQDLVQELDATGSI